MPTQRPPVLSSSNRMVRAYVSVAHVLAAESRAATVDEDCRAKAAAAILIAVSSVESYVNVLSRLWITQNPDFEHKEQIESDLRNKKSLTGKLQDWPPLFFGNKVEFGSGPGQRFRSVIDRRNRLMHFSSDSHDFEYENVTIKGLIDTSVYDTLTPEDAENAAAAAEDFIEYLLRVQGLPEQRVPHALHHWVGRPPRNAT